MIEIVNPQGSVIGLIKYFYFYFCTNVILYVYLFYKLFRGNVSTESVFIVCQRVKLDIVITLHLSLSVNFSHFIQNWLANWNQTWWECSLDGHLQMLFVPVGKPPQKQETPRCQKGCFLIYVHVYVKHLFFKQFWWIYFLYASCKTL